MLHDDYSVDQEPPATPGSPSPSFSNISTSASSTTTRGKNWSPLTPTPHSPSSASSPAISLCVRDIPLQPLATPSQLQSMCQFPLGLLLTGGVSDGVPVGTTPTQGHSPTVSASILSQANARGGSLAASFASNYPAGESDSPTHARAVIICLPKVLEWYVFFPPDGSNCFNFLCVDFAQVC